MMNKLTMFIGDDIAITAYYDYQPAEPAIIYKGELDQPEVEACVDLIHVMFGFADLIDIISNSVIDDIELRCMGSEQEK